MREVSLDKTNYREVVDRLSSTMTSSGERALLRISIRDHEILNNLIDYCRRRGLSVVDGYNTEKDIYLVVVKRG